MQITVNVNGAEYTREVEARLISRGIDYIGPIPQLPGLLGIYFYDPTASVSNSPEAARGPCAPHKAASSTASGFSI